MESKFCRASQFVRAFLSENKSLIKPLQQYFPNLLMKTLQGLCHKLYQSQDVPYLLSLSYPLGLVTQLKG